MKRIICLLLTAFLLFSAESAFAAKARSIHSEADSTHHSNHLQCHVGSTGCRATGNYIKTRTKAGGNKVIGHLEQADEFILLEIANGWAQIEVTFSAKTSPDSWVGMIGWVNSDYIDCNCGSSDYLRNTGNLGNAYPKSLPNGWSFSSGAGAWSTELCINPDGTFYGYYHDFNSTELYESFFNGKFANIQKNGSHSYSMVVSELKVNGIIGSQYLQEDMRHIITDSYGISEGDIFNVFIPGADKSLLSENQLSWLHGVVDDPLSSYALCNMTEGYAFDPGSEIPNSFAYSSAIENTYRCKVNYLRVRNAPNGPKILGHIEQADRFIVTAIVDEWAHIWVEYSDETSPDSWVGLSGWVCMKYLDKQTASLSETDWKKAYRKYIAENLFADSCCDYVFWFVYIDNDHIPELIIDTQSVAGGCHVLTYQDGQISHIIIGSTGTPSYIEKGNLLLDSAGHQGCYYDTVYQIVDGNWIKLYHAENFETDKNDFQPIYTYFINDSEVTKEAYYANLNHYFDHKKAISLIDGTNIAYLENALY